MYIYFVWHIRINIRLGAFNYGIPIVTSWSEFAFKHEPNPCLETLIAKRAVKWWKI